jgi:hypothetical protein
MEPATAKKLFDLVESGGRIFFIETSPSKAPGWKEHEQRDKEVQDWIARMKNYPDRCILLNKPGKDHTGWYKTIQEQYKITAYVTIYSPNPFVTQVRYQAKGTELILLINSNSNASYGITITLSKDIIAGKQTWLWNAEDGERNKLSGNGNSIFLDMGPAELKLLVFDKEKKGPLYKAVKKDSNDGIRLMNQWSVTGQHIDGSIIKKEMDMLKDLKEINEWVNFCGSIVYTTNLEVKDKSKIEWLNLGRLFGVSELFVNGENAGITTTMGNYLKSLKDNRIAQYWTNEGRTIQPLQSMGLIGPLTIY